MGSRSRREFFKSSVAFAGLTALGPTYAQQPPPRRIRFAAIGLNHAHITGQVDAVICVRASVPVVEACPP